ncbi:MAG: hypothetical protein JNL96_16165 [Planctomycetaceae bacterium]|nr:hypothetical protein [Planctomycetaceae bacterium]
MSNILLRSTICCTACCALSVAWADDGKRAVDVPRMGVRARVPQAWDLADWARGDKAFELALPQDSGSRVGTLTCTLTPVPESLEVQRRKLEDSSPKTVVPNSLTIKLRDLAPGEVSPELRAVAGRRLSAVRFHQDAQGRRWGERQELLICRGLLYRFTLESDEAHFDAYAADMDEMFASLRLDPPELGLTPLGNDYWLQRDLRFAVKLPESWEPTLGPTSRTLVYAAGRRHGDHLDNLSVMASSLRPLNLEQLAAETPQFVRRGDSAARVECKIVPQGRGRALETLIRTERDGERLVVLERRFAGRTASFEIKVTCSAGEFDLHERELREALDSLTETAAGTSEQS